MSRPPIPHPSQSPGREQTGDLQRLEYLPLEFSDLVALQDELAVARLGRPRGEPTERLAEPDIARTFMEMSALVTHVLAAYQRQFANEAYLSTAQAASSLVRHARRLAYDPDSGLAASGYAVLVAKDGVSGTVPAGLALASVPLGEQQSEDYETRDSLPVDARLNALEPVGATRPVVLTPGTADIRLEGVGHGLARGDLVAFVGPQWSGFVVEDVQERDDDTTLVTLDREIAPGGAVAVDPDQPPRLLAHPGRTLRPFGATADPALYPPTAIRTADAASANFWYEVKRAGADTRGYDPNEVFLGEQLREPLAGAFVLRRDGSSNFVLRVTAESTAAVTLQRRIDQAITRHEVKVTPVTGGGFTTTVVPKADTQTVWTHIAATVTAIEVSDGQAVVPRKSHPFPADWLTGWATEATLATREPNPQALGETLVLSGELGALTPGRPLVFATLDETIAEVVTIRRAELVAGVEGAAGETRIEWDPAGVGAGPAGGWRLDDLKVFGNVARVSHGRSVREALGGSDGVTAFQRFELRQSPVTILASVAGGDPALEVRVEDVLWQRVEDFYDSGPDDRHYRSETDEEGVTTVVFGDGHNGAVPPSGDKNVRAVYRVGLGRAGNLEPRRLSRLKRAHPLLARVMNLTPVSGGAEPADPAAIRVQATRWIRTFDRAVSVSDVADLALTMPGIARAAARWEQARGIVLVVATSTGEAPPTLDAVRAFLDARRDVTVPLVLLGPQPRALRIAVDIEPDPAYLTEIVKQAVRDALHSAREDAPGMFTFAARDLAQPAFRSEVYGRLEAVAGVVGVRVHTFQAVDALDAGADPVADVVTAGVDRWLHLAPHELTLTVLGSAT